jgi:hypothetical protein
MTSQTGGNTIFLTEQEAQRIRNIVKDRLKKCSELAGHAREPRDSKDAIRQATGASLMADMGGASEDALPAIAVGQAYPPCILSLQDLQPMTLADLQIDTHHRGRRLIVKRVSPVVTLAARSWAMVQDEAGDETERLEVCLHKSVQGEDVLESASVFLIKEPYFTLTDQGEATLRIDHPSDLTEYTDDLAKSSLISANDRFVNAKATETIARPGDEATTDVTGSLADRESQKFKGLDSKDLFRAGCAAYNLSNYQEAKSFFEEQQKLTPDDKDANTYLQKINKRLREQTKGTYDFKKIRAGLSRTRPRVDAASFISNTQVRDSPGRGRGLFATRKIAPGQLVMCEKAFCVVWGHEREALMAMTYDVRDDKIRLSPVGLSKATVQKLLSNSSQIERVMDLHGDYQGNGKKVSRIEDGPVVDTFRVHDIISRNAFGPGSQFGEEGSTGLWIWAAYINHSCMANAKKEYVGDLMVLRANRAINAGEEIFHSYDETSDYEARQTALMTTWGFECSCALCAAEKADDPTVRKKRRDLASEADAFVEREHWANAKRLTIVRARRLLNSIENTYDGERYKGIPHTATLKIQEWLTKASPRQ